MHYWLFPQTLWLLGYEIIETWLFHKIIIFKGVGRDAQSLYGFAFDYLNFLLLL